MVYLCLFVISSEVHFRYLFFILGKIYIDILAPNFMRHRRWNFIRRRDFEFFRDLDRDGFEPGWAPLFYFDLGSSYIKKPESQLKANTNKLKLCF